MLGLHSEMSKVCETMEKTERSNPLNRCIHISDLEGDLILARLSSLLRTDLEDAAAKYTHHAVPSEDTSPIEEQHPPPPEDIPYKHCHRLDFIPGDMAVVIPRLLPESGKDLVDWTTVANTLTPTVDETTLPHLIQDDHCSNPVGALLRVLGIEEVEALDPSGNGPKAGQCQFACVASALCDSLSRSSTALFQDGFRPDLELRRLALHVIEMNSHMYRDFLTVAGGRTRSQSQCGGRSVNLQNYIRSMSSPSCDGDAVTLQALCDALKITVRVVKPVSAAVYDEVGQRQRLLSALSSCMHASDDGATVISRSSNDCKLEEEGYDSSGEDEASISGSSTCSSNTHVSNVVDAHSSLSSLSWTAGTSATTRSNREQKRLYISQEIRPRTLACIDARIKEVQDAVRGRLVWLSHVGDEVHYRYLRVLSTENVPHLINNDETCAARQSREMRRNTVCPQDDCYIKDIESQQQCSPDPPKSKPTKPRKRNDKKRVTTQTRKKQVKKQRIEPSPYADADNSSTDDEMDYEIYQPSVRRGRGKRKIRPVNVTNISRDQWRQESY